MTLSAKLQSMTNAAIILAFAERLPRGRGYVVRYSIFEETLEGDAKQRAEMINAAMEKLIAGCPSQYFWSYNRYKKPDGVTAPDQEEV